MIETALESMAELAVVTETEWELESALVGVESVA